MKRSILASVTVAFVLGGWVASVKADDLFSPPWLRFEPDTTYQAWDFETIANPSGPTGYYYNLYGTPSAVINGGVWSQTYDGHVGIWTLDPSNSAALFIPNTPYDDTKWKDVWTQVTWDPDYVNQPAPVVMVNGVASGPITTTQVGNTSWLLSVYVTHLPFNPSSEEIIITDVGTYDLGQVVVDTQCVPEPSSLALLALGAMSLLSYASRKR